jgi:hypothetical protein
MHQVALGSVLVLLSTVGYAQVHKCSVDGKTVYQQEPCVGTGQTGREPYMVAPSGRSGTTTNSVQLLWPKVEYGMTRADVLRLVPGSREDRGTVTLENHRYADRTFNVRFGFKSDRLDQVHLGDAVSMELNAATRQSFERLVATLRGTYGEPHSKNVEERKSGLYGEAVWRKGSSEITVTISPSTQHHSTILFNFFAEGRRRAN